MNYENAIEKLGAIVEKLSSGNMPLKESTQLFEEGMALLKFCYDEVKVTKGKIMEIKNELGNLKMEEME